MVLKLDFQAFVDKMKPLIETFIKTCDALMENDSLKVFLRFVLHTGNFINAVSLSFLAFHVQKMYVNITFNLILINIQATKSTLGRFGKCFNQ